MEYSKSRRYFLKILGLGSIGLFTTSKVIDAHNNGLISDYNLENTPNYQVNPDTVMAVAQFAYSAYQTMHGGSKDPLHEIVGMLSAMNQKLDGIKGQLEVIFAKLLNIPKETNYLMYLGDMVAVFEQTNTIYNDYNTDIKTFGKVKGRRKFKAAYESPINDHLIKIHGAFNNLKNSFDPVTVSFITICSRVDFELSKLINRDNAYVKNQMVAYLDYFKDALWLNPNNLSAQAENHRISLEKWRRDQSIFLIHPLPVGRTDFYQLKPNQLDSSMFNASELHIIEQLHQLGLLTEDDQNIKFHYEISSFTYGQAQLAQDRLRSEGYLRPRNDPQHNYIPEDQGNYRIDAFNQLLKERTETNTVHYKDHFSMLLSILSAQQAAIESVKFLNKIILLKK